MFWTRQFSSTIIKESNVYNRPLAEFKTGINGVLESEAIKQSLFEFEHDLWNFEVPPFRGPGHQFRGFFLAHTATVACSVPARCVPCCVPLK